MKLVVIIVLILICFGCNHTSENKSDEPKSNRLELIPEPDKKEREKYLRRKTLINFLENPIDLQQYKSVKNKTVTTGVINGMNYYFHPQINDSIFYQYNYLNGWRPYPIAQIIVFKNGKNKHTYKDETETLIELKVFRKDNDLQQANLIGLTKTELELKFGTDYLNHNNEIAYSNENKVLILTLDSSKVRSYRYIKLDTNIINTDLIGRIME
ncbi:hypothetical protein [Aquimarina rubra]|uniref:Lipoprotein n=1 Tax=Aquimarina rubra TaxID=1920033 RepID=A0ABW5LJT7_9FLAO